MSTTHLSAPFLELCNLKQSLQFIWKQDYVHRFPQLYFLSPASLWLDSLSPQVTAQTVLLSDNLLRKALTKSLSQVLIQRAPSISPCTTTHRSCSPAGERALFM